MDHHAIAAFVEYQGLRGLGFDLFPETVGLPLPGEMLLAIAAGLAATGAFDVWAAP